MFKAAVCNGDSTTTRGVVIARSSTIFDESRHVALHGDRATCGNCKGSYPIYGSGEGMSEQGRKVVVEGDLVMCPCGENRVLRGSNPGIFLHSDSDTSDTTKSGSAHVADSLSSATAFDEQVRAAVRLGTAEGYPYFIETADGKTYSGRMSGDGLLPRIETDSSDDYTVYWGDEALARQNGA
jgi:uncharacterized Zn-binding protein involved in type VI secretion